MEVLSIKAKSMLENLMEWMGMMERYLAGFLTMLEIHIQTQFYINNAQAAPSQAFITLK
jgi:hypothetical protein